MDVTEPDSLTMTVKEVAALLRCSVAHVFNLIQGKVRGMRRLPHLKIGRRTICLRDSVLEWMKNSEVH